MARNVPRAVTLVVLNDDHAGVFGAGAAEKANSRVVIAREAVRHWQPSADPGGLGQDTQE
jgi:hypothetical protein